MAREPGRRPSRRLAGRLPRPLQQHLPPLPAAIGAAYFRSHCHGAGARRNHRP
ncbi:hypothetical protein HMJ29_13190 [Hymenobacter taeanensis]|uniref:Uncharacterized protein n=1 Tax=Hymenobacter taeanensis TaxID=2735321 RepID=A0A6M6BIA6_9BACT|nr:hypothetical protein [Hymenobacter taeanensis]QJX47846.1 hypothetical protein HMJ29_13190 [Hymenobacter taeanensis]